MDIFYRLRFVGVGGSGLSVLSQFLVARYQYAVVDGARSDRVELVSVVPQGSTLRPLLFYCKPMNSLTSWRMTCMVMLMIPPSLLLYRLLVMVFMLLCHWIVIGAICRAWGWMLTLLGLWSSLDLMWCTLYLQTWFFMGMYCRSLWMRLFWELHLNAKLTFGNHVQSVSKSAQKLGIMRTAWGVFGNHSLLLRCFNSFVLLIMNNCSPIWSFVADCHLKLLDRIVSYAYFLAGSSLSHRRSLASLCIIFKFKSNAVHPLVSATSVCSNSCHSWCTGIP